MADTLILKREDLYAAVWEEPAVRLAAKYGISSVALAKICKKLRVPLPGRGYWAKAAAGHRVPPRPPLRPLRPGQSAAHALIGVHHLDPLPAEVQQVLRRESQAAERASRRLASAVAISRA